MTNLSHKSNVSPFDAIKHSGDNGSEYWEAREVMPLLEYKKWLRFEDLINRATQACIASGNKIEDHLSSFEKMVKRNQGGSLTVKDYKMSRYF